MQGSHDEKDHCVERTRCVSVVPVEKREDDQLQPELEAPHREERPVEVAVKMGEGT